MTVIEQRFQTIRDEQRMAFMPFVTAGDPEMAMTQQLIRQLAESGVDLIEVGFPYSDPIADGPVIQSSYTRALSHHFTVPQLFEGIAQVSGEIDVPLVGMVSYAIIFRMGVEAFIQRAKGAGFVGLIVPDLPGDEAAELFAATQAEGLDLIQLIAPTTPRERVRTILNSCSGFVYCIAVAGITGERERVADALLDQLKWLRQETDLPLAVGFGISKPEHIDPLRELADAVIVGSGIVRHLGDLADGTSDSATVLRTIGTFADTMVAKVRA